MTTFLLTGSLNRSPWQKAEVWRNNDEGRILQHIEWIDTSSGVRYRYDPLHLIAMKCIAIFLAIPIYLGLYMSWYVARAICTVFFHKVSEWPRHLFSDLWRIIRAPVFAIGMMLVLPMGIFSPLQGRKIVSHIEKRWHFDASYKEDFRLVQERKDLDILIHLKQAFFERPCRRTCYFAYCFQPLGKIDDPKLINIRFLEE